jgi:hypothetical protein
MQFAETRGKPFQQSIDLIKNEENNLVEHLIGFCKMDKGVLEDEGGE